MGDSKQVMDLLLVTQYFDMMKDIGGNSRSNAVFMNHSPGALQDLTQAIQGGFMSSRPAKLCAGAAPLGRGKPLTCGGGDAGRVADVLYIASAPQGKAPNLRGRRCRSRRGCVVHSERPPSEWRFARQRDRAALVLFLRPRGKHPLRLSCTFL